MSFGILVFNGHSARDIVTEINEVPGNLYFLKRAKKLKKKWTGFKQKQNLVILDSSGKSRLGALLNKEIAAQLTSA